MVGHADFNAKKFGSPTPSQSVSSFVWLVVHGKIIMVDNLALHGWPHDNLALRGWTHDLVWKLCFIHPETVQHLCHESMLLVEV
jgi:hypothetical protein